MNVPFIAYRNQSGSSRAFLVDSAPSTEPAFGQLGSPRTMRLSGLRLHWPFALLLVTYVLTAAWLSFRLPAFAAPNEMLHYEYAALMLRTGQLPDPTTSTRMDERHQPPLYYGLVALAGIPFPTPRLDTDFEENPHFFGTPRGNRNPLLHTTPGTVPVLYIGRLISLAMAVLALLAMYFATGRTVSWEVGLLTGSLIAFQPMFLFLSASFSNDLAVTALSALLLAYTTFLITEDRGALAYAGWGVLFAAAMLIKASAAPLLILLAFSLLAKWRATRQFWPALKASVAAGLSFGIVYGPWPVINLLRGLDALGVSRSVPLGQVVRSSPAVWSHIAPSLFTLWRSFWLDWSSGETGYTFLWVYIAWLIILVAALAGWLRKTRNLDVSPLLPWMYLVSALPAVYAFITVKSLMIRDWGFLVPEGRWLLPVLPILAWLAAVGWARWWRPARRPLIVALSAALPAASTLALLFTTIPRQYPLPGRLVSSAQVPASATNPELVFGDAIALIGVESDPILMHQPSRVTLYWQALKDIERDYTISLQLNVVSPDRWEPIAEIRSLPGLGMAPTKGWHQGEIVRDSSVLEPHAQLNGPTAALLRVRLLADGDLLPISSHGRPNNEAVAASLALRPVENLVPEDNTLLAAPVDFGGLVRLIAVSVREQGDGLLLTLWWESVSETATDYTVFVHLLDRKGRLVTQDDVMPNRGRSPTHLWKPGDIVQDEHFLSAELLADGALMIGLYDLATQARLPASQGGQTLPDHAYRIGSP
ncbi:MAG: glycosyltransferase family 39 protein [Candidatus Promineifilaceae bacterium]